MGLIPGYEESIQLSESRNDRKSTKKNQITRTDDKIPSQSV